jgi:carbon-monoxide dehydrogenase iron sulfur subunit
MACASAHINLPFKEAKKRGLPIISRIKVVKVGDLKFPIQCRHCEDAPCAHACPFGAISQGEGMVSVTESLCVGCKLCVMACPFGSIEVGVEGEMSFTGRTNIGSAKKCDLCHTRRSGDGAISFACVEACPKNALQVIEVSLYKRALAQARVEQLTLMSVAANHPVSA